MMRKLIVLFAIPLIFTACGNQTDTYQARLRVVTESGIPIGNARVKLYVPVEGSIVLFDSTDVNGYVDFEIPNKAFYDVKTWKGSWRGCGYVEFMKNELVTKDIYIRPYADPLNTCWD